MNIRLQPPYKHIYSEMPDTIETPAGMIWHIDNCLKGMQKMEMLKGRNCHEYKLFAKVFGTICERKRWQERMEKMSGVLKI